MHNLLLDELPEDDDLRVISGAPKPWSMAQGLDESIDAAFFTGYHAKAGDCATLSHTFSEAVYAVAVNGTPCSEALLNAALAGTHGVPVVLVTGDRTIVEESTRAMPWAVGVAVKDAIGFSAVNSLTPQAAREAIHAGAREAIGRIDRARPFLFDSPYELTIETAGVEHADYHRASARLRARRWASGALYLRGLPRAPWGLHRGDAHRGDSGYRRVNPTLRLYISSDMEGVAGVCAWEQVDARTPHPDFAIYRRYYTQEVTSAIEGARSGGVAGVLVNDSHGPMRNLLLDELPSDVRVIFGNRKPFSMVQDAQAGFGGAFFIGYHGAAGDADAVLCHTYTPSVIYEVRINDVRCSEATLNAGLLGYYGVPFCSLPATAPRSRASELKCRGCAGSS